MIAVMSQNIGAGRPGIAYQARQLGLIFNALIGIVMSVVLATFSGGILRIVSIAPALLEPAEIYLRIVGGACFLNALIPIFSSYLRVFGYTKHSLIGTVVGNVLNIILNSVFLFAFNWGVMGVAVATVISRVVNLIIVAGMGAVLIKAKQSPERITSRKIFAQIVKIGFPSALETALYNIAMTFIVRFMNQMDVDGMNVTARSYADTDCKFLVLRGSCPCSGKCNYDRLENWSKKSLRNVTGGREKLRYMVSSQRHAFP